MKTPKKKQSSKRQAPRKDLLTLNGNHTLASAAHLQKKIIQHLSASHRLTIDAGAAEAFDIGSLQVLIAAQRASEAKGQELLVIAPSGSAAFNLAQSCGFFDRKGQPLSSEVAKWTASQENDA